LTLSERRSWYWSMGGNRKVALFVADLVAQILLAIAARVPQILRNSTLNCSL
jgi:hypothetical protein